MQVILIVINKSMDMLLHKKIKCILIIQFFALLQSYMFRSLIFFRRMASALIPEIPEVDIDPDGVFKYILIKVSSPNEKGELQNKTIVRGYADCPYHGKFLQTVSLFTYSTHLQPARYTSTLVTKIIYKARIYSVVKVFVNVYTIF